MARNNQGRGRNRRTPLPPRIDAIAGGNSPRSPERWPSQGAGKRAGVFLRGVRPAGGLPGNALSGREVREMPQQAG